MVQNNENVVIYIKRIGEKYTFEEIYSELNENYDNNTEKNSLKNYLEYENIKDKEYYILLKVESNHE